TDELGIIDHLARGRELHRPVRIAFAGGERVAERDYENVLHHNIALAQLAAIRQPHSDRDAGLRPVLRIRNARDGELVLARQLLLFSLAARLAPLPAPHPIPPPTPDPIPPTPNH